MDSKSIARKSLRVRVPPPAPRCLLSVGRIVYWSDNRNHGLTGPLATCGDTLEVVKRLHKRLFRINEQLALLGEEIMQVSAELDYHRSINDDAQRDAAIGNYIDREEAGLTAADVRRFEKTLTTLNARREKLVTKRDRLLKTLPD